MKHRLANFLPRYRTTPHSVTGCTPAELMMNRKLRTRLSLLIPDLARKVEEKQKKQKFYFDKGKKEKLLNVGDNVFVRNMRGQTSASEKWVHGVIVDVCGPRSYLVKSGDDVKHVHVDHIRVTQVPKETVHDNLDSRVFVPDVESDISDIAFPAINGTSFDVDSPSDCPPKDKNSVPPCESAPMHGNVMPDVVFSPRRSTRIKKSVVRLNL